MKRIDHYQIVRVRTLRECQDTLDRMGYGGIEKRGYCISQYDAVYHVGPGFYHLTHSDGTLGQGFNGDVQRFRQDLWQDLQRVDVKKFKTLQDLYAHKRPTLKELHIILPIILLSKVDTLTLIVSGNEALAESIGKAVVYISTLLFD